MGDQARRRGGDAKGVIEARARSGYATHCRLRRHREQLSDSLDASFTVEAESMKFDAPHQHLFNPQSR
jgi:hypothetical protein